MTISVHLHSVKYWLTVTINYSLKVRSHRMCHVALRAALIKRTEQIELWAVHTGRVMLQCRAHRTALQRDASQRIRCERTFSLTNSSPTTSSVTITSQSLSAHCSNYQHVLTIWRWVDGAYSDVKWLWSWNVELIGCPRWQSLLVAILRPIPSSA